LCGLQSSQRNGRCGITAHRFKNNILRQLVELTQLSATRKRCSSLQITIGS
jgi:hypothetical protein